MLPAYFHAISADMSLFVKPDLFKNAAGVPGAS